MSSTLPIVIVASLVLGLGGCNIADAGGPAVPHPRVEAPSTSLAETAPEDPPTKAPKPGRSPDDPERFHESVTDPSETSDVSSPPSRPMTSGVLIVGEWSFVPDVDRWATYHGVACATVRANKFGGLKIERRTASGRRRVPLEFRDVTGTDAEFARWIEILEEEVASGGGDDVIVMMGQPNAPLVDNGVTLSTGSTEWKAEYKARLVRLLETLSSSSRRVLWLELPDVWPGAADPRAWDDHRGVQTETLRAFEPRIERQSVARYLTTPRKQTHSSSFWFGTHVLGPILCEARELKEEAPAPTKLGNAVEAG